jgi:hypothetical protein
MESTTLPVPHIESANTDSAANTDGAANTDTAEKPPPLLVDIPVTDQPTAFNIIIAFISVAQRKGAFTMQESSKLWECMQLFTHKEGQTEKPAQTASMSTTA